MKHVIAVAFLTACHATPASPAAPAAPASQLPPAAAAAALPASPPDPNETLVASLVGVWAGAAEGTPYGNFPIAFEFVRQPDGSVHTHLENESGMSLDFLFHRPGGAWILTEEGVIPQVGVQKHTLTPAPGAAWVDGDLRVALAMTGDAMVWTTTRQGTPHVVFRLRKATGPAAEQIRQRIANGPK